MSVNAVSTNNLLLPQMQAPGKKQQDFQALNSALSSGDLAGAQKAFSAFQQDIQQPQAPEATTPDPNTQISTDMKALGTALSTGDPTAMQKAYAALQQDLTSLMGPGGSSKAHHHHHHHKNENDPMNAYQNGAGSSNSVASTATSSFSAMA